MQTTTLAEADTVPIGDLPSTVTADPLPTTQINGVAWSQVVHNGVVYVGGKFTTARPAGAAAGQQEVPRNNFLTYSLSTGELRSWGPSFNGQVKDVALSPDKKTLYVAGQFTQVDGVARYRIAAFDVATGALTNWQPSVNSTVNSVTVSNSHVYIGGAFTTVGGQARDGAAGIARNDARSISAFNPILSQGDPQTMALSPDGTKLVIGGNFTAVNGSSNPGAGLIIVDPATGKSLPTAVNQTVRPGSTSCGALTDLAVDDKGFTGGAYSQCSSTANLEGAFRADWDGNLVWIADYHGDTYGVWSANGVTYTASHAHYAGNLDGFPQYPRWKYNHGLAFTSDARGVLGRETTGYFNFEGKPRPELLTWFPAFDAGKFTGMGQAAWTVSGEGDYIVYGGEFPKVNNTAQQGLVRFAKKGTTTPKVRPVVSSNALRFHSYSATSARIGWTAASDQDNKRLTYRLFRDGSRVAERTGDSAFWNTSEFSHVDTGLTAGKTYSYQVRVSDPDGNVAWSATYPYTHQGGTASVYNTEVLNDNPIRFWPLDEVSGSTATDLARGQDGTVGTNVSRRATSIIANSTGYTFGGVTTSSSVIPRTQEMGPNTFSVETWFRTTDSRGGGMVSFGSAISGSSPVSSVDRMLFMNRSGQVTFGVRPAEVRSVSSSNSYRDGQWHHAVGTLSSSGMKLYVDGVLVGSRTDTVNAMNTNGVWRIGGDSVSGWDNNPTSGYFAGSLDAPAVYSYALTPDQISQHNKVGRTGQAANRAPVADFTATPTKSTVEFDGRSSMDPDGSIASYAWDYGDGKTGTGEKGSHTYAKPGTYQVKLTVKDNSGATGSTTKSVTVAGDLAKPTAAFSQSSSGLKLTVDGGSSSSPNGSVTGYEWDYGDGATAQGKTGSHTYAKAGTYTVTLKITDAKGAQATVTKSVTVSAAGVASVVAKDGFGRTTSGWGTADTGGAWTHSNKSYYSTNGSQGIVRLPSASAQGAAYLTGVSAQDTQIDYNMSLGTATTGAGVQSTFLARVNGNSDYRLTVQVHGNQSVRLNLTKRVNGTTTNLGDVVATGVTYTQGTTLNVRLAATGNGSTTLTGKVWASGKAEPASPQITRTDSSAELQKAGSIGMIHYLTGSSTKVPMIVQIDNVTVTKK